MCYLLSAFPNLCCPSPGSMSILCLCEDWYLLSFCCSLLWSLLVDTIGFLYLPARFTEVLRFDSAHSLLILDSGFGIFVFLCFVKGCLMHEMDGWRTGGTWLVGWLVVKFMA